MRSEAYAKIFLTAGIVMIRAEKERLFPAKSRMKPKARLKGVVMSRPSPPNRLPNVALIDCAINYHWHNQTKSMIKYC